MKLLVLATLLILLAIACSGDSSEAQATTMDEYVEAVCGQSEAAQARDIVTWGDFVADTGAHLEEWSNRRPPEGLSEYHEAAIGLAGLVLDYAKDQDPDQEIPVSEADFETLQRTPEFQEKAIALEREIKALDLELAYALAC